MFNVKALILILCALFSSVEAQKKPVDLSPQEIASRFLPSVATLVNDDGNGGESLGSGFFIRPGIAVTNYHVVKGMKWGTLYVTSNDGIKRKLPILSIVAFDPEADLAIINIPAAKSLHITNFSVIGDEQTPPIGSSVYALGSPKGLAGTISPGIIAGNLRFTGKGSRLQITAPISPGSSGGPVVNSKGQVVGVTVSSVIDGQNLNFAVPAGTLSGLLSGIKSPTAEDDYALSALSVRGQCVWPADARVGGESADNGDEDEGAAPEPSTGADGLSREERQEQNRILSNLVRETDRWKRISESPNEIFFVDVASITGHEADRRVWLKLVYKRIPMGVIVYSVSDAVIDCARQTNRFVSTTSYNRSGQTAGRDNLNEVSQRVGRDTVGEDMLLKICSMPVAVPY